MSVPCCAVCDGTGVLLQDVCPLCEGKSALAVSSDEILLRLQRNQPVIIAGMDPSLHYLAPHVPKAMWETLGDLVAARERSSLQPSVPGEQWISLRLDGSGFSKAVRCMRKLEVLEKEGFSDRFARCMQACLRHLMEEVHGVLGFTQSDEMIVFVKPTNTIRGERQPHFRGGRVQKITTLAAGLVTAKFVAELGKLCVSAGDGLDGLFRVLPHFDCRLGRYDSWDEARSLLMWRAYDCSVNGVSDAVYHTKGSGKEIMTKGKEAKAEWLWQRGLLPLPRHQAYGHLLVRLKKDVQGYNPKTAESVVTARQVIHELEGPVLALFRDGSLHDPSLA